jgi:hypothetical protein
VYDSLIQVFNAQNGSLLQELCKNIPSKFMVASMNLLNGSVLLTAQNTNNEISEVHLLQEIPLTKQLDKLIS